MPLAPHHPDPRTMHPRDLVRGLMRGNRAELHLGYSADNAAMAAAEMHEEADALELLHYARGFAVGMGAPERCYSRSETPEAYRETFDAGFEFGLTQDREKVYPAEVG